ncbi:MAG: crotonase/enoyl-CoA hydratase family protein [Solirubrobacterales bacterium]
MDAERVRIEIADGVADARMVRADKHNGLDGRMFTSLIAAIEQLAGDDELRAVVLSGDGPSFCAGLDFKSFTSDGGPNLLERPDGELANLAQKVAYGWRELSVPVIAALHGACFGGGLQIALGADIRIAAPDTRLSAMEIVHGLIPDMSITQTLPRLVGDDVARELVYTGRKVEAAEALELGLITRIADDPEAAARRLAAEIAERPAAAVRRAKRLLNEAPDLAPAEALKLETELQRELLAHMGQSG